MNEKIPLFRVFMASTAKDAVARVLESGQVAQGPVVERFERDLHEFFGTEVATLNSCTSALSLAMYMAGVSPGDEVITTAQTCIATNVPIVHHGATPVFVDIDPRSGLIDPEDVKRNMTWKTKAIVAVDWAGHPCDYDTLHGLDVPVIEDAAHAVGTTYEGKHVAISGGDYVCFSFQAIKHLTTGDGGALCARPRRVNRARRLRWYGLDRNAPGFRFKQDTTEAGFKYQMNDVAAAIGLENLVGLRERISRHRANANELLSQLAGVPHVGLPPRSEDSSWWLFTIRVRKPIEFIEKMAAHGVDCSPVHTRNDEITAFRSVCRLSEHLTGLEEFSRSQVSIPVGWWLTKDQIDRIVQAVEASA